MLSDILYLCLKCFFQLWSIVLGKKKIMTPIFGPYPKVFIKIILFFIKPYIIMLFVCQTKLGSLGVLHEL